MSNKGVLIYSMNTNYVDYGKLADICAMLVRKNLGLPISVVTDDPESVRKDLFDQIILKPKEGGSVDPVDADASFWRNRERNNYYELSPYEQTLVIDSDYLLFNDNLLNLFDTDQSIYLSKDAVKTNGEPMEFEESRISPFSLDLIWATCFYFKKDEHSKRFFELVEYVRSNYSYFVFNYDLVRRGYRNDFVFAIAAHIFANSTPGVISYNPYPIHTGYDSTLIARVFPDGLMVSGPFESNELSYLKNLSVHLLNKQTILHEIRSFETYFDHQGLVDTSSE